MKQFLTICMILMLFSMSGQSLNAFKIGIGIQESDHYEGNTINFGIDKSLNKTLSLALNGFFSDGDAWNYGLELALNAYALTIADGKFNTNVGAGIGFWRIVDRFTDPTFTLYIEECVKLNATMHAGFGFKYNLDLNDSYFQNYYVTLKRSF